MINPVLQIWGFCALACLTGCTPHPINIEAVKDTDQTATVSSLPNDTTQAKREQLLYAVDQYHQSDARSKLKQSLKRLLLVDPTDTEVIFGLARVSAVDGEFDNAIDLLATVPANHPEAGIPSLGLAAKFHLELQQYAEAESKLLQILSLNSSAHIARRELAFLYNRQGRRHEAVQLVHQLCEAGDVTQDELHSLIVESDAMYDSTDQPAIPGSRMYYSIGVSGKARFLFTERKYLEAVELLEPLIIAKTTPPDIIAFYGLAAAEAQDDQRFLTWLQDYVTEPVMRFPEYWAAVGTSLIAIGNYEQAITALAEAIRRDPTDLRSTRRMVQAYRSLQDLQLADVWERRFDALNETLNASLGVAMTPKPSRESLLWLALKLKELDRHLESVLWRSIAAAHHGGTEIEFNDLRREMKQTISKGKSFASESFVLCGLDLGKRQPLSSRPHRPHSNSTNHKAKSSQIVDTPHFENVTEQVGLNHRYRIATQEPERGFSIYQQYGGGVAVVDYDQDGNVDLYFAQGAADPPDFVAKESNQLLRTYVGLDHQFLWNATDSAGLSDSQYSLGVTAGDWNQDGFPDLGVANIGDNALWINNGDGTFTETWLDHNTSKNIMKSSIAMGDVDSDMLPDIIALNYIDDPQIAVPAKIDAQGQVQVPRSPFDHKPAMDVAYINDGQGNGKLRLIGDKDRDASYGLGLVIGDLVSSSGNEIFVGNDGAANQLWCCDAGESIMRDKALLLGCAFSSLGAPTASMGIATGDYDRSGTLDIHVTNYFNESACLYSSEEGYFRDRNVKSKINSASYAVVGFGSQTLDYSNDGWLDLIVTNGHVDDMSWMDQPFREQMQVFSGSDNGFQLVNVTDSSSYFANPHIGRALARLDFDRDGKTDMVVTHLLEPSALLLNRSSDHHNWVGLKLVGTKSERDAIGARVEVQAAGISRTQWVSAGDGYMCKNDPSLVFGLGEVAAIDRVTVTWPSGLQQQYDHLPLNRYLQLVEGEQDAFDDRH